MTKSPYLSCWFRLYLEGGIYAWFPPRRWHLSSWATKFGRLKFIAQCSSPEHSHHLCAFSAKLIVFYKKVLLVFVNSRPYVFCRKGVLRNFANFKGKHLCWCLSFNKVAGLGPETLLKRGSGTAVFLWILQNF